MAQLPLGTDVLQIEPGSPGTRLISRSTSDNALKFTDAVLSGGHTLAQLVGIRNIEGVFVVGTAGTGCAYTTIQAAFDAVPNTSNVSAPSVVVVFAGLYEENLVLEKDGVCVVGLGNVRIVNPGGAFDTLTLQAGTSTTPLTATFINLTFENGEDGEACVSVVGGAGSTVGQEGLVFQDCGFKASGVGSYVVFAEAINHLKIVGGSWEGSSSTSICRVQQCASFKVSGVRYTNLFELSYDTSGDIPSVLTSSYEVSTVAHSTDWLLNFLGAGTLKLFGCLEMGNLTVGGDQSITLTECRLGALTVDGTAAVKLFRSTRTSGSGTGTLEESWFAGSTVFTASSSEAVSFDIDQPDISYMVFVDSPELGFLPQATTKTVSGFTLETALPFSGTVSWVVLRNLT